MAEGYLILFFINSYENNLQPGCCLLPWTAGYFHFLGLLSFLPWLCTLSFSPGTRQGWGFGKCQRRKHIFHAQRGGLDPNHEEGESPISRCTQRVEQSCVLVVSTLDFELEFIVLPFSFHALSMPTLAFVPESFFLFSTPCSVQLPVLKAELIPSHPAL